MAKKQKPYLFKTIKTTKRMYNPKYGDDRICQCGHPYHRHFDSYSYENMRPVGCKYCECFVFMQRDENE
jgi:hypothetical protein